MRLHRTKRQVPVLCLWPDVSAPSVWCWWFPDGQDGPCLWLIGRGMKRLAVIGDPWGESCTQTRKPLQKYKVRKWINIKPECDAYHWKASNLRASEDRKEFYLWLGQANPVPCSCFQTRLWEPSSSPVREISILGFTDVPLAADHVYGAHLGENHGLLMSLVIQIEVNAVFIAGKSRSLARFLLITGGDPHLQLEISFLDKNFCWQQATLSGFSFSK